MSLMYCNHFAQKGNAMGILSSVLKQLTLRNLLRAKLVLITVALALGCSRKPELIGTWENTTVPELIQFMPDNSGVIQGKNQQLLVFAWKETAKHSYDLDVNFQGQKKSLKGSVINGFLVLEGEGGKETYAKRRS